MKKKRKKTRQSTCYENHKYYFKFQYTIATGTLDETPFSVKMKWPEFGNKPLRSVIKYQIIKEWKDRVNMGHKFEGIDGMRWVWRGRIGKCEPNSEKLGFNMDHGLQAGGLYWSPISKNEVCIYDESELDSWHLHCYVVD